MIHGGNMKLIYKLINNVIIIIIQQKYMQPSQLSVYVIVRGHPSIYITDQSLEFFYKLSCFVIKLITLS
jgi:hypothetical protein